MIVADFRVKENYDFGFATVEHETYDESELENALHENITALLLEMGNGFAFLGKQKEILVGGRTSAYVGRNSVSSIGQNQSLTSLLN